VLRRFDPSYEPRGIIPVPETDPAKLKVDKLAVADRAKIEAAMLAVLDCMMPHPDLPPSVAGAPGVLSPETAVEALRGKFPAAVVWKAIREHTGENPEEECRLDSLPGKRTLFVPNGNMRKWLARQHGPTAPSVALDLEGDCQGDGPCRPCVFRWQGKEYPKMRPTAWRLVRLLWQARSRAAPFQSLAEPVFRDHASSVDKRQVETARTEANTFFHRHAIPLSIQVDGRNSWVNLKSKPPAG
jgi:hypothetical protein